MSNSIPELDGSYINHGILITLTVEGVDYNIASSYNPVVFENVTYSGLGNFLGVSEIQDDLRATNNSISVSLSGVPSYILGEANLLSLVLTQQIKGSKIVIRRAFFDRETRAITTAYTRFSGYVSNFTLSENIDIQDRSSTNSITLQCGSIHGVIERQVSGRRTNPNYFGTDTSMYRITTIADRPFDFGKPFVGNTQGSAPSAGAGSDVVEPTSERVQETG